MTRTPSAGSPAGRPSKRTIPTTEPVGRTVGVNLTWLVPDVVGGSEEYSIRLLEGVAEQQPDDLKLRLYGRPELFDRYPDLGRHFVTVAMPRPPRSKAQRVLLEQTWLPRISAADRIVHHMGGTVPVGPARRVGGGIERRAANRQRRVVTVHDLQPIEFPQNFSVAKRTWLGRMLPRAVAVADIVVCPSRFTADRIVDRFGTDRDKIRVVAHGYRPPEPGALEGPSVSRPAVAERLTDGRFLLYPAIAYRHKRHRDLIAVLEQLPERLGPIDLVFTGHPGPESDGLHARIRERGQTERVHVLGRVPVAELHWLYDHALALAFPSEYEGFGNPCLEAMNRGCPVIAAATTAAAEVVAEAGILVEPGHIDGWVAAVSRLVDQPDLTSRLTDAGRQRAAMFSPEMASNALLAVYRELLDVPSIDGT